MPDSEFEPLETTDTVTDLANWLTAKSDSEGAMEGLAALSSALPVVGGYVTQLVNQKLTDRQARRVAFAVGALEGDIAGLRNDLDQEYVREDEFEELVEIIMDEIQKTRDEERIRILLNILENQAVTGGARTSLDNVERFLRLLHELSVDSVIVLDAAAKPPGESTLSMMGSTGQTIQSRLPSGLAIDIRTAVDELMREGLVISGTKIGITMTAEGAQNTAAILTPMGHQFVSFVRSPAQSTSNCS